MTPGSVARRYARAVYDLAREESGAEERDVARIDLAEQAIPVARNASHAREDEQDRQDGKELPATHQHTHTASARAPHEPRERAQLSHTRKTTALTAIHRP